MSERKHDRLMDDKEVAARLGITRRCVWLWAKKYDDFPKPVSIRSVTRWKESEIDRYIDDLKPVAK